MFLWVFGTLRTYLYHEAQLWSSCFQSPNLTNSCSLVNFLRMFELRFLGWFLVLPRCYEVWRTWPGFSSTRFPTCTPSSLFQENRESLNLRACFSICHPSFNLFQVKLCEHLQNILRKAIWTSFDRVFAPFPYWFSLLKAFSAELVHIKAELSPASAELQWSTGWKSTSGGSEVFPWFVLASAWSFGLPSTSSSIALSLLEERRFWKVLGYRSSS